LVHGDVVASVAAGCRAAGRRVEIETNGTIRPSADLVHETAVFAVSPKLGHSAVPDHRRIRPEILRSFQESGKAVFKFVVNSAADLDEVAALETDLSLTPIWIMPVGDSSRQLLGRMRQLADPVLARGWHLTSRLQVMLWEATRGR
jgi:organic radical activating enzyme